MPFTLEKLRCTFLGNDHTIDSEKTRRARDEVKPLRGVLERWWVDVPSMRDFTDAHDRRFNAVENRIGRIKRRDDHEIDIRGLVESPGRR